MGNELLGYCGLTACRGCQRHGYSPGSSVWTVLALSHPSPPVADSSKDGDIWSSWVNHTIFPGTSHLWWRHAGQLSPFNGDCPELSLLRSLHQSTAWLLSFYFWFWKTLWAKVNMTPSYVILSPSITSKGGSAPLWGKDEWRVKRILPTSLWGCFLNLFSSSSFYSWDKWNGQSSPPDFKNASLRLHSEGPKWVLQRTGLSLARPHCLFLYCVPSWIVLSKLIGSGYVVAPK